MTFSRAAVAIAAVFLVSPMAAPGVAWAEDAQSRLPLAPPGT